MKSRYAITDSRADRTANGCGDRHIRIRTSTGNSTQQALASSTRSNFGEANGPLISSNKIMLTNVSMTDAQMMLTNRIQDFPVA